MLLIAEVALLMFSPLPLGLGRGQARGAPLHATRARLLMRGMRTSCPWEVQEGARPGPSGRDSDGGWRCSTGRHAGRGEDVGVTRASQRGIRMWVFGVALRGTTGSKMGGPVESSGTFRASIYVFTFIIKTKCSCSYRM